ncbi:MAG: DUF5686 family protein [Weeksellaceae bacterium]
MKKIFLLLLALTCLHITAQETEIDRKINLEDMIIDGSQKEASRDLILEVINKQKENSPQNLEAYQFKSYTKFLVKTDYDDIPDFKPKNKRDSATIDDYKQSLRHHDGLLEKGMTYAYSKKHGEKIITDAARISGIKTPLLEIATVDPLPYAFDEDEFSFFYFKSFVNPLSLKGLQHYQYQIQDTVIVNGRKTIEVSFKNHDKKNKPLYGTLFIDERDKALAEFYAEYKGGKELYKSGGIEVRTGDSKSEDFYLTSKYKKLYDAWFPLTQAYYRIAKTKYYTDSTSTKKKNYYYTQTISANVTYSDHQKKVTLNEDKFKGFNQEISEKAFNHFEEIIPAYRRDSLTIQEKKTYAVLDSIGDAEEVNTMIKYGRIFLNGLNVPMGPVDLHLPSLYGSNGYEGLILGAKFLTNKTFHPKWGLEGSLHYGLKDKAFKYMLGANYVVNKQKHAIIGARYQDNVEAFAKRISPLRTGFNEFRERWINGNNTNYFRNRKFEVYGETTFFENLDFQSSLSMNQENSMIPYAFKDFDAHHTYNQLGADMYLRYSYGRHYMTMPYGKVTTDEGSPSFYLMANYRTPANRDGYESIRLQGSIEHSFSWFNKRAHFTLRGGKVLGKAPLWETFNQGLRGDDSWFKPWSLGSTNNFETMPYGQFFSEHFVMAQYRQEWFKITKNMPIYTVVRGIYGDFDNKDLHHLYPFETLEKGYFEGGIEIRRILFNAFGLGAYYRLDNDRVQNFEDNFALKFTLDLPFGEIKF